MIANLADGHAAEIFDAGGIGPLVEAVRSGADTTPVTAAGALWNLGQASDFIKGAIADEGGVEALVQLLRDGGVREQVAAVGALWKLSVLQPNRALIVSAGGVELLVELIRSGAVMVGKEQAAGVLGALALNNPFNQEAIKKSDGKAVLKKLEGDQKASKRARHLAARAIYALDHKVPTPEEQAAEKAATEKAVVGGNNDFQVKEELR